MAKKYYKIIPIKHLLKNNRTAKAGEVIEGSAFINLQESLDRGFCKEAKKGKKGKKDKNKNKGAEGAGAGDAGAGAGTGDATDLTKKSAKELAEYAESKGIELTNKDKASKAATILAIETAEAAKS